METTSTITPFNIGLPMGTILPVILSENEIPIGWLLCDGRPIPRKYADLIGKCGPNTPNLTGRTLIGSGAMPAGENSNGSKANFNPSAKFSTSTYGGEYQTKLTIQQLPSHNHKIQIKDLPLKLDGSAAFHPIHYGEGNNSQQAITGNDEPHNNMPPYFTVNYIVYTGLIE